MITTRLNLWRTASAVAVLTLTAACQPATAPDTESPAPAAASGEAGEAAAGESGAEHGEAGVAAAYSGLEGAARTAMRLQQLKGFVLVAQRVNEGAEQDAVLNAGALVGQGLGEVYDTASDQFGSFNPAPVRAAQTAGEENKPKAQVATALASAEAAIDQAQTSLGAVNHADLAARMIDLSTGLYANVIQPEFNDPIEYRHSLGAALSAREALATGERVLRAQDRAHYEEAMREMDRFIALWPGASIPEAPTPNAQVLAQASRIRLALSPFLRSAE